MTEHPENVKENEEGVQKAEREDEHFAFFMESTSIEYTIQRHCSLKQYGQQLDEKGYGIAMRKSIIKCMTFSFFFNFISFRFNIPSRVKLCYFKTSVFWILGRIKKKVVARKKRWRTM